MLWEQGETATFTADFATFGGGVVDLAAPASVSITDPDLLMVTSGTGVYVGDGVYSFEWVVPTDAATGMWKILWSGTTLDGIEMNGDEWFEVVEDGTTAVSEEVQRLRNLVDRRLAGMQDSDLFFTDDELHTLYVKNNLDVWVAAYEGWIVKSSVYAELIDMVEGGSTRKLSQRHKNAMSMVEFFRKRIAADADAWADGSSRIPGKAFSLSNDPVDVFGIYTVAGINPYYVRTYSLFSGSGTLEEMAQRALTPGYWPS